MKITREELREIIEEVANELGILEVDEGNAFGAAVKKAKEAGEDEFEVDGKTYKVEEFASPQPFSENTLSETLARITGNKKILRG